LPPTVRYYQNKDRYNRISQNDYKMTTVKDGVLQAPVTKRLCHLPKCCSLLFVHLKVERKHFGIASGDV